ncbi:peptidoglycan-binding protein [Streptomyces sp. NPDC014006]|uniref:peptidoglycan-binding protein n=1 Tax=Streptomyces sp. NPDC014006 TaxID=3364870 RepID=UPI0036FDFF52
MPRWTELSDSLDQRVRQLVVQMRRLKDRSGLSLASLAAKTDYSRSSWERYLNGKALAPRQAVEQLARITGAEPTRLLVLHELAEQAWQQRIAPTPSSSASAEAGEGEHGGTRDATDPAPPGKATAAPAADVETIAPTLPPHPLGDRREPRRGFSGLVLLAAVVAAALVGLGAGLLIGGHRGESDGMTARAAVNTPPPRPTSALSAEPAAASQGPYVFRPGTSYPCKVHRVGGPGGELSAGYSTTRTAVLAGPGWDVVEAQCLLAYRKLEPGAVDGVYGQQTIAAVMRLQKQAGLPADGVVGPHTWRALRR